MLPQSLLSEHWRASWDLLVSNDVHLPIHNHTYSPQLDLAALANAGGTLTDIWIAHERGVAAAMYSTAPFLGPGMNTLST